VWSGQKVNGKLYAIGGYKKGSGYLDIVEIYDPITNKWSEAENMPSRLSSFATTVYDEKIYVLGGQYRSEGFDRIANSVFVYDPSIDEWNVLTSMPTPRKNLVSCAYDGNIYAIGGSSTPWGEEDVLEIYNIDTDSWTTGPPMPTPRTGIGGILVDKKIYVVGGAELTKTHWATDTEYFNTVEVYDIVNNTWIVKNTGPKGYADLFEINDVIYCLLYDVTSPKKYDISSDSWSADTPMPTERKQVGVGVINDKAYVIGGKHGKQYYTANEEFTPGKINNEPTLQILSPTDGDVVQDSVIIQGSASDEDGTVQTVEIKIDSNPWIPVEGTSTWSYTWDTTTVQDGSHMLYAHSFDGEKHSTTQSLQVTVDNIDETSDSTQDLDSTQNKDELIDSSITNENTNTNSNEFTSFMAFIVVMALILTIGIIIIMFILKR